MITFSDFQKLDLRVGKIISAEKIVGSEKLLKLKINIGSETKQIVSGIAQYYQPEKLVGKLVVLIVNLETRDPRDLRPLIPGINRDYCFFPDRSLIPIPDRKMP